MLFFKWLFIGIYLIYYSSTNYSHPSACLCLSSLNLQLSKERCRYPCPWSSQQVWMFSEDTRVCYFMDIYVLSAEMSGYGCGWLEHHDIAHSYNDKYWIGMENRNHNFKKMPLEFFSQILNAYLQLSCTLRFSLNK